MTVLIQGLEIKDTKEAAELEELCFGAEGWSSEAFADTLRLDYAYYLCARIEGRIRGIAGARLVAGDAYISNVSVHPKMRREKIGYRLMKELLSQVLAFGNCRRSAKNDHTGIQEYTSLSCLSLDTVFCSCRDQRHKIVTILPLKGLSGTYDYPDELPREAGKEGASEKTDVYSVAYLGVEVSSWTGTSFKIQGMPEGLEALLTRCLSPFPALRPDDRRFDA